MRTISPNANEASLEHGADIAKAKMRLLLDGRRHLIVGRDAELAGAHQDAMTGRDFHAVAVACERRADARRSDVLSWRPVSEVRKPSRHPDANFRIKGPVWVAM